MATLVFTAIGTALGGPFGGAIGSLIGNQIDKAVIGAGKREGPRLKELSVTTSSYGTPVARHYGTMRAAGSIIWATELVESSEKSGGKGKPSVTTYSYSVSFAVALSSRPIRRLGRIWADGNLLRGAAGDLKTGGALRVYKGHGDQRPDPLIAASQGGKCPAFRGIAYCVFESLQLADFGNRIPALTFEVVGDDGEVTLAQLVEPLGGRVSADASLSGLAGYSDEGGALASHLEAVGQVYPLICDASGEGLALATAGSSASEARQLPEAAVDDGEDGFGGAAGQMRRRAPADQDVPEGLRYYDIARDYQTGLQRAEGRARPGRSRVIDFPGALQASTARDLANAAAERAGWSRDTLAWRVTELDPSLTPGMVVRVPGKAGNWRIESWEWRERGVELELRRLPVRAARRSLSDPGQSLPAPDFQTGPTRLVAFELPWDGDRADVRQIHVAATSETRGWTGAALYLDQGSELVPAGASGNSRSVVGSTLTALPPSRALLLEGSATMDVELASPDFQLVSAAPELLATGANRAMVGGEVLQFAIAAPLGSGRWRLGGLLRGRGGTEAAARAGCPAGADLVLLDDTLRVIEPGALGVVQPLAVAAIGLADEEPVRAPIMNPGIGQRPLIPVHPRVEITEGGGMLLGWTRRARGAWAWSDGVEVPLNEQGEEYLVGLGDTDRPDLFWKLDRPSLDLTPDIVSRIAADYPGRALWVRQLGSSAASDPLLLTVIAPQP